MCRNTLDFELLRNHLNDNFESYIREWFPNAYRLNDSTYRTGDFNDSKVKRGDGSLSFNMRDKYAKDFSTGETAGDIISIYAKRFCGGNNGKAFKELVERYSLNYLFNNNFNNKKGDDNVNTRNRYGSDGSGRAGNDDINHCENANNETADSGTKTTAEATTLQENITEDNPHRFQRDTNNGRICLSYGCDNSRNYIDNGNNDEQITIEALDTGGDVDPGYQDFIDAEASIKSRFRDCTIMVPA